MRTRLVDCFTAVFPGLTRDEAPGISIDNFPAWDSSHHFVLMKVIEESFDVKIPEETVGEIDSFPVIENYLVQEGQ